MVRVAVVTVLCLLLSQVNSQSVYSFQPKKELVYLGIGAGSAGLGLYFKNKTNLFTTSELGMLKRSRVNTFDRWATYNDSRTADNISDVLLYGSIALPVSLLLPAKTRKSFGQIAALYGEASLINAGLTLLIKNTINRPRPFVYNEQFADGPKKSKNAKTAFISGHTSITATNTFFAAKVFSDFYPDSKLKPVVWTLAATIPAVTGWMRVEAGKHYPTDVIGGYLLGAAVGYLVPQLHKKDRPLKVFGGLNGIQLQYNF